MVGIDRFQEILDACAQALPPEIFRDLNGGVLLLEEELPGPDGAYTLGRYRADKNLGRFIEIFYGSFQQRFPDLAEDALQKEIDAVLRGELVEHLRELAGESDVDGKDRLFWDQYRQSFLGFIK